MIETQETQAHCWCGCAAVLIPNFELINTIKKKHNGNLTREAFMETFCTVFQVSLKR